MAQQGGQPKLFLDQRRNLYFYHDPRTHEYVYSDGSRIPVPGSSTPRGPTGVVNQQAPAPQYNYSGSPPTDSVYIHGEQGQQYLPPGRPETQQNVAALGTAMSQMNISQPSSRTYNQGGIEIVDAENAQSRVRTRYGTSPADRITDPALYNAGIRAHRALYGTGEGEVELLYSNFRLRKHDFFSVGRVFLILWVEPAGESGSVITNAVASDQAISTGAYNERVFSKVRRFVVIREGANYCSALPIATYGQRGVSKQGVKKSEHAIIHSTRDAPQPRTHENPQRGEAGMRPISIRVVADDPGEALDPMSRLDFGKVHTIQHNIKVRPFGVVHANSKGALLAQFQNVWSSPATAAIAAAAASADQTSRASTSSSASRAKPTAPRSATSGGSRRPNTARGTVAEESDQSEEDEDDEEDNEDEDEEATGSTRSHHGRESSAQPHQSRNQRAPLPSQVQQQPSASSSGSVQAAPSARSQWFRDNATRLRQGGYTQEQTFHWLVAQIMREGKSEEAAAAEVRRLLSGKAPQ